MKKSLVFVTLCVIGYTIYAQLKTQDVFSRTEVVWYGLDFTKAKFIGSFENIKGANPANANEIVEVYIPAWNELFVNEPYNFDLENTFWKRNVYYDLKPVTALNENISKQDLMTMNSNIISKGELSNMISLYKNGDKKEGLGLTFIIENFNKPKALASLWVVFFDIETRKILLHKHCSGKPMGFGIRNYWAGAIKNILNDIRFRRFEKWSRETSNEASDIGSVVK